MSISVILAVYNEEERLEISLKTLQWCDEIIVLDKNSSDRTREIAERLGAKVFIWNNTEFDPNEISYAVGKCTSDWILTWTASDVIHPKLAFQIKELTGRKEFDYDILWVPYSTYILGIDSKRSPWHTDLKPYIYRKSAIKINSDGVHNAMQFASERIYKFEKSEEECIYHLTHINVDTLMERHTRYWRAEARYFEDENMKIPFRRVCLEILKVTLFRKTFLMGRNGVMLMFAFLSYYMMSYVYKWEKKYSRAPQVYSDIRNNLLSEWEKVR
jgi:glycosyltransferase involved in cell wall biosynthesis